MYDEVKIALPFVPIAALVKNKQEVLKLRIAKEFILQTPKLFEPWDLTVAVEMKVKIFVKQRRDNESYKYVVGQPIASSVCSIILDSALGYIISNKKQVAILSVEKEYEDCKFEHTEVTFRVLERRD